MGPWPRHPGPDLRFRLGQLDRADGSSFIVWHGGQEAHALWFYTSSNGVAQPSSAHEGCVEVPPTLAGPLTVTARAGSATVSKQFTVATR